jgi:hypothetical protein
MKKIFYNLSPIFSTHIFFCSTCSIKMVFKFNDTNKSFITFLPSTHKTHIVYATLKLYTEHYLLQTVFFDSPCIKTVPFLLLCLFGNDISHIYWNELFLDLTGTTSCILFTFLTFSMPQHIQHCVIWNLIMISKLT